MRGWMALAWLAIGCAKAPPEPWGSGTGPCAPTEDTRTFAVLHLNDTYRIEGLMDGSGGLARVRSLRESLEEECPDLLVTHAGDALFPSLTSRLFYGEQMIAALNRLDGDGSAYDPRFLITFGNHEFDKSDMVDAPILAARVAESQFSWLGSNIDWGEPAKVGPQKIIDHQILVLQGVPVGVFSLTIGDVVPKYVGGITTDYAAVARDRTARLREDGARVVIALTHLPRATDEALLRDLGEDGPDLILGGHDHSLSTTDVDGRLVLKGDADAVRVRTAFVTLGPDGVSVRADEGTALTPADWPQDPTVRVVVDEQQAAFKTAYCVWKGLPHGCLDTPLTVANTELVAEEYAIRKYETNLGDWLADVALAEFAEHGAQVALLNSGSLRLNQNIPAGVDVRLQVLEELFPYPMQLRLLEVSGAVLQSMLDRSVESWDGSGHWLQLSGLAYQHDVEAGTATDASLITQAGLRALDPDETVRIVVPDYVANGGDGYTMLKDIEPIALAGEAPDLKDLAEAAMLAATEGLSIEIDGRICSSDRPDGACLVAGASKGTP
jgi:2',3'-cyclic-nucleotide 2'-phosphodiesterase (5'-nucleotidase family)